MKHICSIYIQFNLHDQRIGRALGNGNKTGNSIPLTGEVILIVGGVMSLVHRIERHSTARSG